ncbi:SDR family NAD(P)-dependent oxidoreductase [Nitrospira moscoviensis]|uniref:3-oxoacyl-[acyl-carrier-protein] reductase FabG n=1 Tax=Nitrospira moscoviensis TaxID=42253 RepID=A0A0K2G7G5_NITMO|nr:SDR family oxidoreductase [Nitrospira moscoviensis]ALA56814.1 3-oxoacyl-[acyl-carrier-protein] reductase FabG [Nitrospira moscoviensis]
MNRLAGKVALVTGGNAGIGEAIVRVFAKEGASVVVTGRRQAELDRVVEDIGRENGRALAVAGSVTDDRHARTAVEQAVRQFGALDILVNNAGVGEFGRRIHELDDATWERVLNVNLTGVFHMTRAAVPHMLARRRGSIVNISSVASVVGIPMLPAYAASKGALDALTRAVAIDYAQDGIRCNVVNPGLIATPMAAPLMANPEQLDPILAHYPIRRPGTPEEVAYLVLYLASDEAAWVTGATYMIDGGKTAW